MPEYIVRIKNGQSFRVRASNEYDAKLEAIRRADPKFVRFSPMSKVESVEKETVSARAHNRAGRGA